VDRLKRRGLNFGARWLGSAVHVGLDAHHHGNDPVEAFLKWANETIEDVALSLSQETEWSDQVDLGKSILTRYVDYSQAHDHWEVVAVETTLQARLPRTHTYLVGTVDLLVRQRDGKLWVVDNKTCKSFVDPMDVELDDQMTSYLWLVEQNYGERPGGAIYNELRKKIPATPYELKNGGLSKSKSIDTTPEVYLAAVLEHGLDPMDYVDMFQKLEHNDFFRRTPIMRTRPEIEAFAEDLAEISREIRKCLSGNAYVYGSFSRNCSWGCDFLPLCRAAKMLGDVESLKQVMYEKKGEEER